MCKKKKSSSQLGRLTTGERLLLDRRRSGETQRRAAIRHGTTQSMYGKWERGVVEGPSVKINFARPHERCLLYRRRAGYTQAAVAEELCRCKLWVTQMERGDVPCDELLWYWEQ